MAVVVVDGSWFDGDGDSGCTYKTESELSTITNWKDMYIDSK